MILGMDWLTLAHVLISLVGIATGLVLLLALMKGRNPANWAAWFLASTVLTSVTGFVFFPIEKVTPAQITGVLSLIALALGIYALYPPGRGGALARRLCGGVHHRALPELLRSGGPVIPENPALACHCPRHSAQRTCVPGDPGRGSDTSGDRGMDCLAEF